MIKNIIELTDGRYRIDFINRHKLMKRIETNLEQCISDLIRLSEEDLLQMYEKTHPKTNIIEMFSQTYMYKPLYESTLFYIMQRHAYAKPVLTEEIILIHKLTGNSITYTSQGDVLNNDYYDFLLKSKI